VLLKEYIEALVKNFLVNEARVKWIKPEISSEEQNELKQEIYKFVLSQAKKQLPTKNIYQKLINKFENTPGFDTENFSSTTVGSVIAALKKQKKLNYRPTASKRVTRAGSTVWMKSSASGRKKDMLLTLVVGKIKDHLRRGLSAKETHEKIIEEFSNDPLFLSKKFKLSYIYSVKRNHRL
jgi:hypothetical protein